MPLPSVSDTPLAQNTKLKNNFLKNVFIFSLSGRIAKIPLLFVHNPWSTVKKVALSLSKTAVHNFYWLKENFKNSNACNYRRIKIYLPWALTKSNQIHIYRGKNRISLTWQWHILLLAILLKFPVPCSICRRIAFLWFILASGIYQNEQ